MKSNELLEARDVSDVIESAQSLHLACAEDADDESNKSLFSATDTTAAVTQAKDTSESRNADGNGLSTGDGVTLTAEDADDVAEANTNDLGKRRSVITCDDSRSDVVESTQHGEPFTANGRVQSEEFDKAFIISNDQLASVEVDDETNTNSTDRLSAVQSPDCCDALTTDADKLHAVGLVECGPDSTEQLRSVDTLDSAGRTTDDAHPASAAGDSAMSGSPCDTLRSLISQLKSAISAAQSGITFSYRVIVGKFLSF